ncbi:very long chain fatty acid elongase 7-like [Mytilus galloprovincialis]|uniref:very long chain fatty acid elongase 7-like n=1 Tax=Mytilus galloprovincialis TaxID=29158 RepID=UPI003F7BDD82
MEVVYNVRHFYHLAMSKGDPRVNDWLLMETPIPVVIIFVSYLLMVKFGPKLMEHRKPLQLHNVLIAYNLFMVLLSAYMFYEFLMSAVLAGYSIRCQPVDYSNNPIAIRMAKVCWLYFFSKIIEILDTIFFILRKKDQQITFLHVYHHSTMLLNWWLGVKYIAGGQSFFLALLNTFVHILMYGYYGLSALGPHVQKYLWWKKYITKLQLAQFFLVIIHTSLNIVTECDFPNGYNVAVFVYAFSLVFLFANFYKSAYEKKEHST